MVIDISGPLKLICKRLDLEYERLRVIEIRPGEVVAESLVVGEDDRIAISMTGGPAVERVHRRVRT